MIGSVVRTDPQLGRQMIMELDGPERLSALTNASWTLANDDLQTGLDWLGQFEHLEEYDSAMTNFLPKIVERDPRQAMNIVMSLNEANQQVGVERAIGRWVRNDYPAALQWTENQPAGTVRDTAIGSLLSHPELNVNTVVSLVERVDSDTLRNRAVLQGYVSFVRREDGESLAEDFLDQVNASPETLANVEKIKKQLQRFGR